jgi:hypothetical protein
MAASTLPVRPGRRRTALGAGPHRRGRFADHATNGVIKGNRPGTHNRLLNKDSL